MNVNWINSWFWSSSVQLSTNPDLNSDQTALENTCVQVTPTWKSKTAEELEDQGCYEWGSGVWIRGAVASTAFRNVRLDINQDPHVSFKVRDVFYHSRRDEEVIRWVEDEKEQQSSANDGAQECGVEEPRAWNRTLWNTTGKEMGPAFFPLQETLKFTQTNVSCV